MKRKQKRKIGDRKLTPFGKAFIAFLLSLPLMWLYVAGIREPSLSIGVRLASFVMLTFSFISNFLLLFDSFDDKRTNDDLSLKDHILLACIPLWYGVGEIVLLIPSLMFEKVEHQSTPIVFTDEELLEVWEGLESDMFSTRFLTKN